MTTNQTTRVRRNKFDTSALKATLVVSGVLATLIGGEMLAGQEFSPAAAPLIPTAIPVARLPADQAAWELSQTPITQLVIPDPVVSTVPIVDGQLLVGGEPVIGLVIPDASQMAATAVDTSGLLDNAPIVELVVPAPVAIPASSASSISVGNAPLVGVVVGDRGNNNNGGGGASTASVPAPTTTSQSSG